MTFGEQPAKGDVVLHCGHAERGGQLHFLKAALLFEYARPNGTKGWTRWIVCCNACWQAYGMDGAKVPKRAEAVWDGAVPRLRGDGVEGRNGS